jgi:parallel beta-helix repeat protein
MEDVQFLQNRGDMAVMWTNEADEVTMRRVEVRQNGNGLLLQGDSIAVEYSQVVDNNGTGIRLEGDDGLVSGTSIERNRGYGLYVRGDSNRIENNEVISNVDEESSHGLLISGSENIVRNNTIRANGEYGIYLDYGSTDNEIIGNRVSENLQGQIYAESRSGLNHIENNQGTVQYRRDSPGVGVLVFVVVAALTMIMGRRRSGRSPLPNG